MIRKEDIKARVSEWGLRHEVIEKDYALGWLLSTISQHPVIGEQWIFKGGTCIKKCYSETYRFSEDLDFSLTPEAPYSEAEILAVLKEVTKITNENSGLSFPEEMMEVKARVNKQGLPTFQCKLAYQGPLANNTFPRILFDITAHEPILDIPVRRPIFHPYPDAFPIACAVKSYSFNELLAEKTRALFERARPRDLYDVVYLIQNNSSEIDLAKARELFSKKCGVKNFPPPSASDLVQLITCSAEVRAEWSDMLAHQLAALPSVDDYLARLPAAVAWVDGVASFVSPSEGLSSAPVSRDTSSVVSHGIQYWGSETPLESIRFAGANLLVVEFDYNSKHRVVEPYSFRKASTGNLLFYGHQIGEPERIKAFKVTEIQNLVIGSQSFAPRFKVEFS